MGKSLRIWEVRGLGAGTGEDSLMWGLHLVSSLWNGRGTETLTGTKVLDFELEIPGLNLQSLDSQSVVFLFSDSHLQSVTMKYYVLDINMIAIVALVSVNTCIH